jgi:hypothetical protein
MAQRGLVQPPAPVMTAVASLESIQPNCSPSQNWTLYCRVTFTGSFGSYYELFVEKRVNRGSWVTHQTAVPSSSPWDSNTLTDGAWTNKGDDGAGEPAPNGYAQFRATVRETGGGPTHDGPDLSDEDSQTNWNFCFV